MPPKEVTITLPLSSGLAKRAVVLADLFGCEPWEMGAHLLKFQRAVRESLCPICGHAGHTIDKHAKGAS